MYISDLEKIKHKGHENQNVARLKKQTLFIQQLLMQCLFVPSELLSTGNANVTPALTELTV